MSIHFFLFAIYVFKPNSFLDNGTLTMIIIFFYFIIHDIIDLD